MLVSMTGFGSGESQTDHLKVKVEIRSVNHRFFEPVIRLPKGYLAFEEPIRNLVATKIHRGRLEIFSVIEDFEVRGRTVTLDSNLLESYQKALSEAGDLVPVSGELDVSALLKIPELFQVREDDPDHSAIWPTMAKAVGQALDTLVEMRRKEGKRLQEDILQRLQAFLDRIEAIATKAPAVVEAYRERLLARVRECGEEVVIDEERILGEIALMADRSEISEEIVRARSHVMAFRAACREEGAVGRKLDFLLQEMHREITTIGSKASDTEISTHVVEAKAELEKMREQVQNIE